ncbi:ATP-binding protein [Lonepinella sp. BR2474]|uniref:ATP-binding protein n=1 Tax=Lonepinella sp. BR2474 TaxID=3434548 RepID=UPI003F6DB206
MWNFITSIFTKRYTVKLKLTLFVVTAICLVGLISLSAIIGLNNSSRSLSDLRENALNHIFSSMTLGVKTSQIATYSLRLSQTIRALEYKEASEQLEQHIQQLHQQLSYLENTYTDEDQQLENIVQSIKILEKSVKELLNQAYQRHIANTTIISKLNQSLLHLRHIKRFTEQTSQSSLYLSRLDKIERLIEDATMSAYNPSTFLSIQAIFSVIPKSDETTIIHEWQNVENQFDQIINQANELSKINLRILFLTNQIDALVKQIDLNYSQLALQQTQETKEIYTLVQKDISQHIYAICLLAFFIIMLVIILGKYIHKLVGIRLSSITQALIHLSQGDKTATVPQQHRQDEIGDLARAFDIFHQNVMRLDQTDALLRQTFLAMRDGLAVFDHQKQLISYNVQFATLLNIPIDKPITSLLGLTHYFQQHNATVYGGEQHVDIPLLQEIRNPQEPLEIQCNQSIFEWRISQLQSGGIVAVLIDRTQRKKLENDLAHSQKMRTIGQLTGGIAHDFNNLLAVIIGNLDLINTENLSEKQIKRLQNAIKAAENSATLTQRLLAYARKQPLHPSVLEINPLLRDLADLVEHSLPPTIKVRLNLGKDLPPVYIDKNQLETALVNLVVNAKDALEGSGDITIQSTQLLVQRTERQEQMVQISVIDNGKGMDVSTQKQIFEPFFTTKKNGKGSGLGLSMVYGFIRQSKGRVLVESEVNKGTTMMLQIPLAKTLQKIPTPTEDIAVKPSLQKSLLLVEDQKILRETLTDQLTQIDYHVVGFETAEQVIDYLSQHSVDYLLSDIVLSGKINGIELVKIVEEQYPTIKLLLMTGNHTMNIEKALHTPIVNKPFKLNELQHILNTL